MPDLIPVLTKDEIEKSVADLAQQISKDYHNCEVVIVGVLKGLDYAHKNGVIHRDIKPANVLIDRETNPQVADFGIAQVINKTDQEMTSSDIVMGTLAYMSPEQKVSTARVNLTTDIYSVGVMIYEILTGRKPSGRFKLPSELNTEINNAYDTITNNCLAQNPDDRYPSATTAIEALQAIQLRHNFSQSYLDLLDPDEKPLVGRADTLTHIANIWTDTQKSVQPKLVVVHGDAGIGKTKLVTEFWGHKGLN